ncbi:MAG TPA: RcnB family protein [Ramlibacter sp.]|nr:RcnB family protein [Ramlibacter sp.]
MKSKSIALAAAVTAVLGLASVAQAEVLVTDQDRQQRQADRYGYSGGSPVPGPVYYGSQYGHNGGHNGLPYVLGGLIPGMQDRGVHVNNWRDYGLERPPRDHRWVRIGNQFVLQRR